MSTTPSRTALHPMLWVAAASVTALSLAGVAKLTGLLPESGSAAPQTSAVTGAAAPEPVAPTRLATAEPAEPAAPAAAPAPALKAEHHEPAPAVKHTPARPKPAAAPAVAKGNPPPADAVPAPRDAQPPTDHTARRVADAPPAAPVCRDCGVIENIEAIQQKGEGSGLGAVGGAILGGVLGHQVGEGSGKQIARIGGAVLGGFAGNEAERRYRTISHYQITVRLDDGTRRVIEQQSAPAWHEGDAVRIRNGEIVPRQAQGSGSQQPANF